LGPCGNARRLTLTIGVSQSLGLPLASVRFGTKFSPFSMLLRATPIRNPRSRCRQEDMLEYVAYALLGLAMIGCVVYVLMSPESEDRSRPKDSESN